MIAALVLTVSLPAWYSPSPTPTPTPTPIVVTAAAPTAGCHLVTLPDSPGVTYALDLIPSPSGIYQESADRTIVLANAKPGYTIQGTQSWDLNLVDSCPAPTLTPVSVTPTPVSVTPTPVSVTPSPVAASLPFTGGATPELLGLGGALVLGGAGALTIARRRRGTHQ